MFCHLTLTRCSRGGQTEGQRGWKTDKEPCRVKGGVESRCTGWPTVGSSARPSVTALVCASVRPNVLLLDIALCCVGKFLLMLAWRCNGCVSMPSWGGMPPASLLGISHITATELAHTSTHPQPCYISAISYLDPQQVRGQKLGSTIPRIPSKCHKLYRVQSTQRPRPWLRPFRQSNGRQGEYWNPASTFY